VKFLGEDILREILARTNAANGDVIFFGADKEKIVNDALGALRAKIGHDRGFATSGWKPLWVVDFPMFEFNEESRTWGARHHPFTALARHGDTRERSHRQTVSPRAASAAAR